MKPAFLGLTLFGLIGLSFHRADETILADAERSFSEGVKARTDAETARKHFSRAARDYDELWQNGHGNSALGTAYDRPIYLVPGRYRVVVSRGPEWSETPSPVDAAEAL